MNDFQEADEQEAGGAPFVKDSEEQNPAVGAHWQAANEEHAAAANDNPSPVFGQGGFLVQDEGQKGLDSATN